MIALDDKRITRLETWSELIPVATRALASYCLDGSSMTLIESSDDATFAVQVAAGHDRVHPYLGNVAGRRFVLRLRSDRDEHLAASRMEAEWMASLLRETDLSVPEPVPACDGALVPSLWAEGLGLLHSVLYRWPE